MSELVGSAGVGSAGSGGGLAAKPTITQKEVSWHEAVAAHLARKKHAEKEGAHDAQTLRMLAAPMVERVSVAGLLLEPYSLAHAILLEQLGNPFEVGGDVTTLDIGVALMVFGERELLQGIVTDLGAEKARKVIYEGAGVREVLTRVTRDSLEPLKKWLHGQFAAVASAGGVDAEEAAAEASVAAVEAVAGNE